MAENESKDATGAIDDPETGTAETSEDATGGHDHEHDHDHEHEDEVEFVEDPTFDVQYKGDCAYEVGVTIPSANEDKQVEKMLDELKSEAEVPGFRKGRAPRKLLERKFGRIMRNEADGKLVSAAFERLVKEQKLRPIAMPEIDGLDGDKEREPGTPLEFTMKFEVAPHVELGKYRELELERPVLKVNDNDVQERIDEMRARYSVYEDVPDGQKAQDGDQVLIDFKGTVDGEEFRGGSAENYPYVLGTGRFFPELEEVLKGAASGETKECDVTLPDDYFNEELRGKTAHFTVTVNGVKRRNEPELDDDFAQQAGYESVEDMRTKIADELRRSASEASTQILEERALEAIIANCSFEIPKSLVEGAQRDYYQESVRRMMNMRMPIEQVRAQEEELQKEARDRALRDIQRIVLLNEIAEAEGIEVTEEDFEQEMESAAQRMGVDINVLGSYMAEDEERRSSYEDRIYRQKAMKVVLDSATITDKEVEEKELEEEASGSQNATPEEDSE